MSTQKTVLVTGSTSGIGLEIALGFAKAGFAVAVHGIEADGPDRAREIAERYRVPTLFFDADLRRREGAVEMVRAIEAAWGRVDVLVNNAGMQYVAPIEEFPADKWSDILALNLSAAFHLSQAVWGTMKRERFGRIINVASVHGLRASEFKVAYVAAKHGLIGLTKTLALEGAPHGITVNALCPGYVRTPLVDKQIEAQALAHGLSVDEVIEKVLLKKQPVKEFIPAEALSEMALMLASAAARTITGASFVLDGGWTAQ